MSEAVPLTAPGRPPGLLALGVDHRTAPLEVRERVAFAAEAGEELLVDLMARPEIAEAYLLSTCNRTEIYLCPRDRQVAYREALRLGFARRAPEIETEGRVFVHHDHDAARHLLAVAAGLESMVVGEPEILGQVRQAGARAAAAGSVGPVLERLLRAAAITGRRARAETAIGAGAVSLGYALVELARQIFGSLADRTALVLGAGETAGLATRALVERGIGSLWFANRDPARAEAFRREHPSARHLPLEERYQALAGADLVVATTGAGTPLLVADEMAAVMRRRPSRPLLAVDLAVPRDVDPRAAGLENLFLHTVDSLEHLVRRNLEQRLAEVPKVERIVAEELHQFLAWHRGLEAEPLIAELQKRAEAIRRQEVEGVLPRFPAELHDDLDRLTRALVRKILHHPSHRLRRGSERDLARLELARELFQLGADDEEP